MDYSLEAFINWCNNMAIANEGTLPSNISKICDKWTEIHRGTREVSMDKIVYLLNDDTYDGKFDGITEKDLKDICKAAVASKEYSSVDHGMFNEPGMEKYKKEADALKLCVVGALGNGDYFFYSVKNGKMYETMHDNLAKGQYIFEMKESLGQWMKEYN